MQGHSQVEAGGLREEEERIFGPSDEEETIGCNREEKGVAEVGETVA